MYSRVFYAVRGGRAEAVSQTASLTSDVTPGQRRAPFLSVLCWYLQDAASFYWTRPHVSGWMCPGAANAPPHLRYCISISCTQLSFLFTFTLQLPLPHLFFFSFPSTSFISLVPFFPARRCFSFHRFRPAFISFSFPSSRTAFLLSFFLIPLRITSRAAAPVSRQYRQMRTFLLIISLIQSALTKRRISNNYSWNDIKGWAWLFFFYLTYRATRSAWSRFRRWSHCWSAVHLSSMIKEQPGQPCR